ncbi:response regulator [Hwanghaeella grinnelliae]|uniref:histidine kinase n=1 Tax=Hwanghaeella grinnelliae TaxID=2500179 RepID=A0A3S2VNC4_9PROT|nr:response regulator [Hwanghaeella grinnelliae]RVU34634.1 response regulator [Hwanghaeella grinnelliae]
MRRNAILIALWVTGMAAVGGVLYGAGTNTIALAVTLAVMTALGLFVLFTGGSLGGGPIGAGAGAARAAANTAALRQALEHLDEAVGVEEVSGDGLSGKPRYLDPLFLQLCGLEPGEEPTEAVPALLAKAFSDAGISEMPDGGSVPSGIEAAAKAALNEARSLEVSGPGPRNDAKRYQIQIVPVGEGLRVWRVRDVTDVRRSEDKARDRLAVLSRALENAPFGLLLLDRDRLVREVNASFRQLIGRDSLNGASFLDLFKEEDRPAITAMLDELENRRAAGPLDVSPESGQEVSLTLHVSRSAETRGGNGGMLVYVLDATERKRLEMQFAQSQKMQALGQLAGGVAHDFNNMLTAIIGFCDLVLQRHHQGEQTFADVMQITQNAKRAARLVRQLLAFSRQQPLQPRLTNVTDILAEISSLLRRVLGERVTLKMTHGRDLGLIKADHSQLEQVVINLAVNARDAIDGFGELNIETSMVEFTAPTPLSGETAPPGRYLVIAVIDTGAGIPDQVRSRIFDPFFTTKGIGEGTGLGLSMVYGSLQQMGGFITVDSRTEGETGTTFRLYIPEAAPHGTEIQDDLSAAGPESDVTGGGEILLVEDEDPVRLFSARALRSKGYVVTEARTGAAALEILAENKFDLLVTDMMMPEVDGATLIKTARKDMPDLPVVCISGYTQEAVAKEITALPKVYFLPKPFSLKQLAGKVKAALQPEGQG